METQGFVLDPDGDLVLVLENPTPPFHGCRRVEEDQDGAGPSTPTAAVTHDMAKMTTTDPSIMYLLSSQRLRMTCRYFRTALSGRWPVEVGPDGLKRITANDWDPDALLIVLLVLHDRTADLPMDMGLDILAGVALISDYYGCEESVSPLAAMWLGSKGAFLDGWADDEIATVIFVSLVFGLQYEFSCATALGMERRLELISMNGLPIPQELIGEATPYNTTKSVMAHIRTDRMAAERETAMRRMLHALITTYERLRRGELGCTPACRDNLMECFLTAIDVQKYLALGPDEVVRRCTLAELQHCEKSVVDVAVSRAAPMGLGGLAKHVNGVLGWECIPISLMIGYGGLGARRLRCKEFRGN